MASSVLLAVSGGADSMALLYGAAEVAKETGWRLSIGHVHHGWREREADRDLAFVAEHGRRLGLPSFSLRRDAAAVARELGLSPEAGAREIRYAALFEMAREAGASIVATAHQSDDAVESHVLARERRGGIASLAGPRPARADGVVRPLLGVSREEILGFLAERGIAYRRDASNGNLNLSRNRVRRRLAELRRAPGGADALRALGAEVARLGAERLELESRYEADVRPSVGGQRGRRFAGCRAPRRPARGAPASGDRPTRGAFRAAGTPPDDRTGAGTDPRAVNLAEKTSGSRPAGASASNAGADA